VLIIPSLEPKLVDLQTLLDAINADTKDESLRIEIEKRLKAFPQEVKEELHFPVFKFIQRLKTLLRSIARRMRPPAAHQAETGPQ
jgi:hypothetical protein